MSFEFYSNKYAFPIFSTGYFKTKIIVFRVFFESKIQSKFHVDFRGKFFI